MNETRAIPHLVRSAPSRVKEMIERDAAMPLKRNPAKAVAAMRDQEPEDPVGAQCHHRRFGASRAGGNERRARRGSDRSLDRLRGRAAR